MIDNMRRNMRHVFWLFFLLFLFVAGFLIKLAVFDARDIASHPSNRRLRATNTDRLPGMILDRNGHILAESTATEDGGHTREYRYGAAFAHALGTRQSGTGLETKYNFDLQSLDAELWQRLVQFFTGRPIEGNTVVSTLDAALQVAAYEGLNGRRGAVVAIEPSTGRILAMVSAPDFPLSASSEDWRALLADDENGPLLNRAAQGLYAPGSTFKLIVAAAALEHSMDDLTITCTGSATFGSYSMRCFDAKAHGAVNLDSAMAQSCNVYFATLGEQLGAAALQDIATRFGFNQTMDYPLAYRLSSFVLREGAGRNEMIETAIGQGRTLATPLQMATVAATIANDGVMMSPQLLDSVQTRDLYVLEQQAPKEIGAIVTPEIAARLEELMVGVVSSGTGTLAQVKGITVTGKTGTAENATGNDHSWFIGYAPAEGPTIAVAVLLEETGGGTAATRLAGEIMAAYLAAE